MSKPIILTCGTPHSYTSMTSRFLMDNGGYCDDTWDNPKYDLNYSRYESKEIQEFVYNRKNFKSKDLMEFFASLPKDKIVTLKAPLLIFFINEIDKYTDREIKVVYVFRNPQDIIMSSMDKSKNKSFIYYYEKLCWTYNFMVKCKFPVYPLVAERLLQRNEDTAKHLLEYCGLYDGDINFQSIDPNKTRYREPTYIKYRFANFLWKRLSRFFNVYELAGEE